MKTFLAKVVFYLPCPREREIRIEASNIAIAVRRAIQEVRKDFKGKKIKQAKIDIQEL